MVAGGLHEIVTEVSIDILNSELERLAGGL